jgi:hypothetical protein
VRRLVFDRSRRDVRARVVGAGAGAVLALAAIGAYALTRSSGTAGARPHSPAPLLSRAGFERRSGVRIVRVAVTGDGGLVDLRYQVIDSDAADGIHNIATPPELVDERTGVVVRELFMGHMHHGRLKPAQQYYLVFDNPGNLLRPGTRVTVQLASARISHVPVR